MSGYPLAPRSKSGEVAEFIDDDQFASGQSVDKCGYEIVSLFWHSVPVNHKNPYTGADVHLMAHNDYMRFAGPDVASNQAGMSNAQLVRELALHNFKFQYVLPPTDWHAVRSFLLYGYPVLLGGVDEATVYDVEHGGCPYSWIRPHVDYFHILLATGLSLSDELLCRDTANIGPDGKVRIGPRRYRTAGLKLTTAVALVPSWLPVPSGL